jgi:lysophospholipase L1-like esterase
VRPVLSNQCPLVVRDIQVAREDEDRSRDIFLLLPHPSDHVQAGPSGRKREIHDERVDLLPRGDARRFRQVGGLQRRKPVESQQPIERKLRARLVVDDEDSWRTGVCGECGVRHDIYRNAFAAFLRCIVRNVVCKSNRVHRGCRALTLALALVIGAGALGLPAVLAQQPAVPADRPVERSDANSRRAHAELVEKGRRGRIDVYFVGDSITRRWGALDYPLLLKNWTENFFGWNAANFGWGGDSTQNILWRLQNGEFEGIAPKVIVVQAGTNNVAAAAGARALDAVVADVTRGIFAIVELLRGKAPDATIVVTSVFPRNDNMALMPAIDGINRNLAALADRPRIHFLRINNQLAAEDGRLHPGMMGDGLHPTVSGYQIWADALKPILTEVLGPPAADDRAPPPTGDPSAMAPVR